MKAPPTDLQLLQEIYSRYYPEFVDPQRLEKNPRGKIHVPIDVTALARHFGVDEDIVFGRLYYHLNSKYGYSESGGSRVDVFCMQVGGQRHCVQFPLLASVLADLRDQRHQFLWTTWLSIVATIISLVSLWIAT